MIQEEGANQEDPSLGHVRRGQPQRVVADPNKAYIMELSIILI